MLRLFISLALITVAGQCLAQECDMALAFSQPNENVSSGSTKVWGDDGGKALLFKVPLNVNTDGTRRSYSVEDFWGRERALNNLCNAMSDACAGLNESQLRNRRILTQEAFAAGWPAADLARTKISPSIIPFKDGKPCPLVDGYLVSATALHKRPISDACEISNYVDALTVPALVLPKNPSGGQSRFAQRGALVGDLIVAIVPGAGTPVFGVVGDSGPLGHLGEGSIALNGKLLQKTEEPQNYRQVRNEWVVPRSAIIVFPRTRDENDPLMTLDRIEEAGRAAFAAWGGLDRLKACVDTLN